MTRLTAPLLAILLLATGLGGCSKRQVGPGIMAGVGAGLLVSGAGYRASLDDSDELFGTTAGEKATTGTLMLGGTALMLAGIIWSVTTQTCETDSDCWAGDVCERSTDTCVKAPAKKKKTPEADTAAALPFTRITATAEVDRCTEGL
jgi:hypothetical protein